jgi:hypothetical protein
MFGKTMASLPPAHTAPHDAVCVAQTHLHFAQEAHIAAVACPVHKSQTRTCCGPAAGAAGKVFGWASAPCKPCPRNMITDGYDGASNASACITDDGFGYTSEGAHTVCMCLCTWLPKCLQPSLGCCNHTVCHECGPGLPSRVHHKAW